MATSSAATATAAAERQKERGAFIVFEGIDRCGKTTQSLRLVEALNKSGTPVMHMRFPDRTTALGKILGDYLQSKTELDDHATHLVFAANRWECHSKILAALHAGTTVICDRYVYSGVAFTGAKNKVELEWCKAPDRGLPAPDAVFYMQLSVNEAEKRGGFGEERYDKRDFQQRVKDIYEQQLREPNWLFIDAHQTPDALHEQLKLKALQIVRDSKLLPIARTFSSN